MIKDYRTLYPDDDETIIEYCRKLEKSGYEEMFIRKAARAHFNLSIKEMGEFFEQFETARLRHMTLLVDLDLGRRSFEDKVAGNLGISRERAEYWVKRFHEVGEVDFIGRTKKVE